MGRRIDLLSGLLKRLKQAWVASLLLWAGYFLWPVVLFIVFAPLIVLYHWWAAAPGESVPGKVGAAFGETLSRTVGSSSGEAASLRDELADTRYLLAKLDSDAHDLFKRRLTFEDDITRAVRRGAVSPELASAWPELRSFDPVVHLPDLYRRMSELDLLAEQVNDATTSAINDIRGRITVLKEYAEHNQQIVTELESTLRLLEATVR